MEAISMSRAYAAGPDAIEDAMADLEAFMLAAGFDAVDVDGRTMHIENGVGIATIELTLELVDVDEYALAYEQRDGIFETMRTTYTVAPTDDGSEVTVRTEFALDIALAGGLLDATVIKRQRKQELTAQLDWLETVVSD
ncbi:SRPBCC family protein [Halorubellus sp. PRR65]|uniref:SRPBCC family protein n=1 Tax=Halorubellus sp. PRR65 TaxID=3098148 RepID=UPI002B261A4A|nr:SRPBCC family protein [Halorubellus sp. PRR65]